MKRVLVIGAGLAGSEAAWSLAQSGHTVFLLESKGLSPNPAQKLKTAAELVCTNSLKSKQETTAHGLLKHEMRSLGSLVLETAQEFAVPAGDALAVDREKFSSAIHQKLSNHPHIHWVDKVVENPLEELKELNCAVAIVASGPLTLGPLEQWIQKNICQEDLYFYDALAPVVDADSLDLDYLYFKGRGEGDDYLNSPLNKEEYETFIKLIVESEKVPTASFEEPKFFEACLPVDVMAERGVDTPRFSCMKPLGLERPDGTRPYAVVQLRKENLQGSAFNLVGFQNRLKYSEQKRIFRTLPGFQEAEFLKFGSVHRNTFINSKKYLTHGLNSIQHPQVFFAGQITGVEGYTESSALGLYVAEQAKRFMTDKPLLKWPESTCIGALIHYLKTWEQPSPSSINFGLLPTVTLTRDERKDKNRKKIKKQKAGKIVKEAFDNFYQNDLC